MHGRRWAEAEIKLLGIYSDEIVASKTGRSPASVKQYRLRQRIAPDEIRLLGTAEDIVIARQLQRSVNSVKEQRKRRKIPIYRPQ